MIKIRNSKTQEERTVSNETWETMRGSRKDWYAIGAEEGREVAAKPVAFRQTSKDLKPQGEPEAAAPVII